MLVSDNMEQNIKNYKYYLMSYDNHLSFAKNIQNLFENIILKDRIFQGKSPILT